MTDISNISQHLTHGLRLTWREGEAGFAGDEWPTEYKECPT